MAAKINRNAAPATREKIRKLEKSIRTGKI